MNFHFSEIIGTDCHAALKWLGRQGQWFQVHQLPDLRSIFKIDWEELAQRPGSEEHKDFLRTFSKAGHAQHESLITAWLDAMAAGLANGPKLFVPTAEQFEAMQHVELHIPVADYRQPYPSVVIAIPPACRRDLAARAGVPLGECPRWGLLRSGLTAEGKVYVTFCLNFGGSHGDQTHFFQDRPEFGDLEDAIRARHLKPGDCEGPFTYTEACLRASLNLMLMLTHYGCRLAPGSVKHSKKRPEKLRHGDCRTVEMVQNVVVRRVVRAGHGEEPVPTGREVAAHWRRGHWRNQHFGPGNVSVKMIFINPVLVRSDRAVGDFSESRAEYAVK